jgi:hypothetical protein
MPWATFEAMNDEVTTALSESLRLAYASCGSELQIEVVGKLADLDERVERFRMEARARQDEPAANGAYVLRHYLSGVANFLNMWVYFKFDQMEPAWDALVDAQAEVAFGLRFIPNDEMAEVAKALRAFEVLLFPPQRYVSRAYTFDSSTCSICKGVYGDCGHVAGRLYMGEMCFQQPIDYEPDHVAIVDEPSDKGCRWVAVRRGDEMICTVTKRVTKIVTGEPEAMRLTTILARPTRPMQITRLRIETKTAS